MFLAGPFSHTVKPEFFFRLVKTIFGEPIAAGLPKLIGFIDWRMSPNALFFALSCFRNSSRLTPTTSAPTTEWSMPGSPLSLMARSISEPPNNHCVICASEHSSPAP